MSAPSAAAAGARAPRWMRVALVLSLALNLGIAGLVAGAAWRSAGDAGMHAVPPVEGFRSVARALPSAHRESLHDELGALRGEFRDIRREVRTAQRDLLTALRAEPFDPGTAADALARQAGGWERIARRTRAALLSELARMDPAARAAFADALEASLSRRAQRAPAPGTDPE